MKVKTRVTITNDRLPQLRREVRKLAQSAPTATPSVPAGNLAAQARAIAEAEGLDVETVFAELCRVQRIRQRLGSKASDLDVARALAVELGVTVEELLEASGLGPNCEVLP
jgi:protein-disulfide isomerase-like protein with CxxC motif